MADPLRVGLSFSSNQVLHHDVAEGIVEYIRTHKLGKITIVFLPEDAEFSASPGGAALDGMIVTLRDPSRCKCLPRVRVPVVNLLDRRVATGLPTVCPDDRAAGALAARHLLECGFKTLCFLGFDDVWSIDREEGFFAEAKARGGRVVTEPEVVRRAARLHYNDPIEPTFRRIVDCLPPRCGVMASNDDLASRFIDAAACADRSIPDDLAVIGIDDLALKCELAAVPVSSIPLNYRRIGMEAIALLDRQMSGEDIGSCLVAIPPTKVTRRRSTDAFAFPDPDLAEAVRFIREHACSGIVISTVLQHLAITHAHLSCLFQKYVGHSPAHEIHHVRVHTARRLLLETDLPLTQIAERSGFCSQSHMTQHFHKTFGQTPRRFRTLARI